MVSITTGKAGTGVRAQSPFSYDTSTMTIRPGRAAPNASHVKHASSQLDSSHKKNGPVKGPFLFVGNRIESVNLEYSPGVPEASRYGINRSVKAVKIA